MIDTSGGGYLPYAASPTPNYAGPSYNSYGGGGGYRPPPPYRAPSSPVYQGSVAFSNPKPSSPSGGGGGGNGGGGGGSNPWESDPGYQAALLAEQQGDAQIAAMLNKQIAQALIQYGDPTFAKAQGDARDAAFARQNYLTGNSTLARLDKAHGLAKQAVVNNLSGRGLLFSGETGYQNTQADQAYGNNVYDAQQAVVGAINNYRQTAMQQEMNLRQAVIAALENAYTNWVNGGAQGYGGSGTPTNGFGAATPSNGGAVSINPALLAFAHQTVGVPQVASAPAGTPGPRASTTSSRRAPSNPAPLYNPYTTGRKKRG